MEKYNAKWLHRAALFALGVLILLPVALTALYSLFSPEEVLAWLSRRNSMNPEKWMPVKISPMPVSFGQYMRVLLMEEGILKRFFLSLGYAAAIFLGQAVFVPAVAYALSAYRFRGRGMLFSMMLLLMLLPFQVTMVPNMLVLRNLKLMDTVWAVILPAWFTPFLVVLIRQYMLGISPELYEAAQLDGAGPVRCYGAIALPVCAPVLGVAAVFSFADSWNLVEQPLVFLRSREDLQPLSTVFNRFVSKPEGTEFAGAVIYILPALFIYLFFMDEITAGIQLTEMK